MLRLWLLGWAGPPGTPPPDIGSLPWLPVYPNRFPRRLPRVPATALLSPILPIPNPTPPTVWALPAVTPTILSRRRLPVSVLNGTVIPLVSEGTVLAPLRWLPIYPDQVARRRRSGVLGSVAPFQQGATLDVPKQGGWRPIYPDLFRRRRMTRLGYSVWRIDPTTLINTETCIEWQTLAVVNPMLLAEVLINPTLIDENVSGPGFVTEGVC